MTLMIRTGLVVLFASLLGACGSGSPNDAQSDGEPLSDAAIADMSITDVADQLVADGQVLTDLLATVSDPASAEAVEPQIKAIIENYRRMFKQVESGDNLSFSDMAALASRAPEIAETQEAVMLELQRIYTDHPDAADRLRDAVRDFGRQP